MLFPDLPGYIRLGRLQKAMQRYNFLHIYNYLCARKSLFTHVFPVYESFLCTKQTMCA